MFKTGLAINALAISGALALPQGSSYGSGHGGGGGGYSSESQRAQAVIDAFRFAWDGYSEYCFGNDELHPVSNTCGNSRYEL